MSGEKLREELARIAEDAPRVHVPDDLYARGRRATTRARILAAGGALACLALLFAVIVPSLQTDRAPVAGDAKLGVPDRIEHVPQHVDERERDLKTGIGAAAFVTELGIPVVIDAATGGYHLLTLDGLASNDQDDAPRTFDSPPVALSPDGRHLAWGWLDQGPEIEQEGTSSGIRIADLVTGDVREVAVYNGDQPIPEMTPTLLVNQLSWSADGRWLAWGGRWFTHFSDGVVTTDSTLAGVVEPGSDVSAWQQLPGTDIEEDLEDPSDDIPLVVAVSNNGDLGAVFGNQQLIGGDTITFSLRSDQQVSSLWPYNDRWHVLIHSTTGDAVPMVRELPDGQDQAASTLASRPHVLGVLTDGRLLMHEDSPPSGAPPAVEVVTPDAEAEKLIEVGGGVHSLTLAVDLMPADHPTVERPEPDWPWSWSWLQSYPRWVIWGVPIALLTLALGGAAVARSRHGGPPDQ